MADLARIASERISRSREQTLVHASFWVGAAVVGICAVFYANLIGRLQSLYFKAFEAHPLWVTCLSPVLFLAATILVTRFAPQAKGSGIPQVLEAVEHERSRHEGEPHAQNSAHSTPPAEKQDALVSIRTAWIKILSSCFGILGGASIGREGPTVQIAASAFAWIGMRVRKRVPSVRLESFLVAGAAAGVAAAFNTPLAGITFAIEEVSEGLLGSLKQPIMLSVIISGITAQALIGNYLYFGHPSISEVTWSLFPAAALIGVAGGLGGGLFAKFLSEPTISRLPRHPLTRALICGLICSLLSLTTHGSTAGSGYEVTRAILESGQTSQVSFFFPLAKMLATVLSYLSGMAGGIFAPSLSMGAGIGAVTASWAHFPDTHACMLLGMVAFFSGAIQAPLTGAIIVMEMTDQHALVIPFMIAGFLAQGIGRVFLPVPLYRYLAERNRIA